MLKTWFVILSLLLSPLSFSSDENVKIAVSDYLNKYVATQVKQYLPEGKFTSTVKVEIDKRKLKEASSGSMLRLPLGSSSVSMNEIDDNSFAPSMIEYLDVVKKLDVVIAVSPTTAKDIREQIVKQVSFALYLDNARGDMITMEELNPSFSSAWQAPETLSTIKFAASKIISPISSMEASGVIIAFAMLTGAGLLFWGIQLFGKRFSKDASLIIRNLAETSTNSGTPMMSPAAGSGVDAGKMQETNANLVEALVSKNSGSKNDNSWDSIENDVIFFFASDCLKSESFKNVPMVLLTNVLPPEKAKVLEGSLPKSYIDFTFETQSTFSNLEVETMFKKFHWQYKKACRSTLTNFLMKLDLSEIVTVVKTFNNSEKSLIINHLPPITKECVINALSVDEKIEIADASKVGVTEVSLVKMEQELAEKLSKMKFMKDASKTMISLAHLQDVLLKANTFAEDEAFFLKAKEKGSDYHSVLKSIELIGKDEWADFNLNFVANAFFGYSESIQAKVKSFYSDKKLDWLNHFFKQASTLNYAYRSKEVKEAHDFFKMKVKDKTPAKIADLPPSFNKAA